MQGCQLWACDSRNWHGMITKDLLNQAFEFTAQSDPDTNKRSPDVHSFLLLSSLSFVYSSFGGYFTETSEIREHQAKQHGAKVFGNRRLLWVCSGSRKTHLGRKVERVCMYSELRYAANMRREERGRWNRMGSSQGFERCPLWLWCKFSKSEIRREREREKERETRASFNSVITSISWAHYPNGDK